MYLSPAGVIGASHTYVTVDGAQLRCLRCRGHRSTCCNCIVLRTVTFTLHSDVVELYRPTAYSQYRAVKCRLIWHFRGQALLLRVPHVVACDNVRDCVFLKDDLNRVKKGLHSYELNFSSPTNSQNIIELN